MFARAPTPYLRLAFPNDPPPFCEFLDMEGVAPKDLAAWREKIVGFVRALTYRKEKRLLMKSPPHTGRISVLRELFPGAKFVHIVRDPYSIFPSTQRLWHALDAAQGLQVAHEDNLNEYVLYAFERMYQGFRKQAAELGPNELTEIRYEDLIRDPVNELARIYQQLSLGDFSLVRPKIEALIQSRHDYLPNQHELDADLRAGIRNRWSWYFETYGYGESTSQHSASGPAYRDSSNATSRGNPGS